MKPQQPAFCHIVRSPLLAQAQNLPARCAENPLRRIIRPHAILEVVRRQGRRWGLSAQYEEARLSRVRG
ncbi:MAG: hypothetical protein REI09_03335 [Candidatus Dactylopiibacterium sp.]|nr:hypothetical protein [Candidatus Dactylopiibacterium sp.]